MSEYSKETVLKTVSELFDIVKEQQSKIEQLKKNKQQASEQLKGFQRLVAEDLICDESLSNLIESNLKRIEKALQGEYE